jgi:hypothetical protein
MDSDKRLADHFMGKQHIGFQLMRDQLDAIKIRRDERRYACEYNIYEYVYTWVYGHIFIYK